MSTGTPPDASVPSLSNGSLRQRFLAAIAAADEAPAARFLDLLVAPDTLFNLSAIVTGLATVLPPARAIAAHVSGSWPTDFDVGLSIVERTLNELQADPHYRSLFHGSRRDDPMWGVITGHQLYSLFAYSATSGTDRSAHTALKAQVLAGALGLTQDATDTGRGHATPLALAAKAARQLLKAKVPWAKLPAEVMPGNFYLAALDAVIAEGGVDRDARHYLDEIRALLKLAWRKEADDELLGGIEHRHEGCTSDGAAPIHIRRASTLERSEIREALRSGLAPADVVDDFEYAEIGSPDDEPELASELSLVDLVRRRQHQTQVMERRAQALSLGWQRLTAREVASLLQAIREFATPPAGHTPGAALDPHRLEAGGILATAFWTARDIPDARRLLLFQNTAHIPKTHAVNDIGYVLESDEWLIRAIRPKASPRYQHVDLTHAVPTNQNVRYPASPAAVAAIRSLPAVATALQHGSAHAFAPDAAGSPDLVEQLIQRLRIASGGRLTRPAIRDYLMLRIANRSGDFAAASLLFGHAHYLADTQLHYKLCRLSYLAQLYTATAAEVSYEARRELGAVLADEGPALPASEARLGSDAAAGSPTDLAAPTSVGSPISPQVAAVKRLIGETLTAVAQARSDPINARYLVTLHNRFTLYTILLSRFGLGLRDVNQPLPRAQDIDLVDGTVVVSDKDDAARYSSRVLPLAPLLAEQLKHLVEHNRAIATALAFRSSSLRDEYRIPGVTVSRSRSKRPELPLLFFLSDDSGSVAVSPISAADVRNMMAQLIPWFGLPSNCNRHFLPAQLIAKGCPAECIDYLFGHWSRGREPLGRFATLPIGVYLEHLRPILQNLLVESGWRAISGLQ